MSPIFRKSKAIKPITIHHKPIITTEKIELIKSKHLSSYYQDSKYKTELNVLDKHLKLLNQGTSPEIVCAKIMGDSSISRKLKIIGANIVLELVK